MREPTELMGGLPSWLQLASGRRRRAWNSRRHEEARTRVTIRKAPSSRRFCFSLKARIKFYVTYFLCKTILIWRDCKHPRLSIFCYEMLYSAGKLLKYPLEAKIRLNVQGVRTIFGTFRIRPNTCDLACASPAFERNDIDALMRLLDDLMVAKVRILFLDIGADFGTYTIAVGNKTKLYNACRIASFEPSSSSFSLLRENVALNGLEDRVSLHNVALNDTSDEWLMLALNIYSPGGSGISSAQGQVETESEMVRACRLDSITDDPIDSFDVAILKIDVEGFESRVLAGGRRFLLSGKPTYLLIEDFVNPEIANFLNQMGAVFENKLTPYNSWWSIFAKTPA